MGIDQYRRTGTGNEGSMHWGEPNSKREAHTPAIHGGVVLLEVPRILQSRTRHPIVSVARTPAVGIGVVRPVKWVDSIAKPRGHIVTHSETWG